MAVNNWANYFTRTYDQIRAQALTQLGTSAPEITDHSLGNPLIRGIEVWAGMTEYLHYYIDQNAREAFLGSARRERSGVEAARFNNYRIRNASAASVVVTFSITTAQTLDIVIPKNTKVTTTDGNIDFYTTSAVTLTAGQTRVDATVLQLSLTQSLLYAVGTGQANQMFKLDDNAADGYVTIVINNITWQAVDNFFLSLGTDNVFQQNVSFAGNSILMFGDGFRGGMPSANQQINISYQTTQGSAGNVTASAITVIANTINAGNNVTVSVTNQNAASGGTDIETLASLKRNVPSVRRTVMRGVTKEDFKALTEMVAGVARAAVNNACGNTITVFIVPTGGGLASPSLLSQVGVYLEDKKIIGRSIIVQSAGIVRLIFDITIGKTNGYSDLSVKNAVITNITNLLSFVNQEIGGTVYLSDIYQTIENTVGVQNDDITRMTTVPYARPINQTTLLDWNVETLRTSTQTTKWKIQFVQIANGVSRFQLFRNNLYVGTFSSNVEVVMTEVKFTILENYQTGAVWQFYSYNYFGNISLTEMSLPTALASDINITFR